MFTKTKKHVGKTSYMKKLPLSLIVLVLRLRSILPEGRGVNSLCAGREWSFRIHDTLLLHLMT